MSNKDSKTDNKSEAKISHRKFLGAAAATATGATALGFLAIVKAQAPVSLRFQSTWPAKDIFHEYALDFASKVNAMSTEIPGTIPGLGPIITSILRGGGELSAVTLARFYSVHIWFLPAVILLFIGIHMYLVIRLGISNIPGKED